MTKIIKIFTAITIAVSTSIAFAASDVNMKNNVWTFDVSSDSILVWTVSTWTTASDLFWKVTVAWTDIQSDKLLESIDVRYMSGQVDKKVFALDDKLSAWNKVFVLFKPKADGWTVWANTTIVLETKNLVLSEYGKTSNWGTNAYDVLWKVSYATIQEPVKETPTPVVSVPQKEINTAIIEDKKTGIFDHIWLISLLVVILAVSLVLPNKKFIW